MTEPGYVAPAAPGWWVRTNRVGINANGYTWTFAASGRQSSLGATAGIYNWVGTAVGHRALQFINSAAAAATSITIPTHQVGDIIVLCPFAQNSGTVPVKPGAAGTVPIWLDIDNTAGTNLCALRTAYFVATATTTTSGTWTGANGIIAVVLRGQNVTTPIGGHGVAGGGTLDATAPAVTMAVTDGTSILLEFFGARSGGADPTWGAAPTGYTQQTASGPARLCLDTKNVTTSDGAVTQTRTGATAGYHAATVEIVH